MSGRWRTYTACKMLSCTPTELDEQPAALIDDLLAIGKLVQEVSDEQMQQAMQNGGK